MFCVVEKWNWHKEYYLRLTPLRALYAGVSACIFDMSKGSADSYMLSSLFPLLCFVNVLGEFVVTGQRARKYESMTLGGDNQEGAVQNVDAGMECEIMHYSQQKKCILALGHPNLIAVIPTVVRIRAKWRLV